MFGRGWKNGNWCIIYGGTWSHYFMCCMVPLYCAVVRSYSTLEAMPQIPYEKVLMRQYEIGGKWRYSVHPIDFCRCHIRAPYNLKLVQGHNIKVYPLSFKKMFPTSSFWPDVYTVLAGYRPDLSWWHHFSLNSPTINMSDSRGRTRQQSRLHTVNMLHLQIIDSCLPADCS